eukprot:1256975-Heterocapsa_arctica.AAC.1
MGKRMPPRRIAPGQRDRRQRAYARRPDARRGRPAGTGASGSCSALGQGPLLSIAAEGRGSLQALG